MKLSTLTPNPNNPRFIRDTSFEKLVKSIRQFPEMLALRPIVADRDGVVLGGNMRYRALVELGYDEIPDNWVIFAGDLSEAQRLEFLVKDNAAYGEWDYEALANEWDELPLADWGVDVPIIDDTLLAADESAITEAKETSAATCPNCGFELKK